MEETELREEVRAGDREVFKIMGEVTWKKGETGKGKGPSQCPEVLPHLTLGKGAGGGLAGMKVD